MERRISAIVAADMVGYSRLVELDEAGTVSRQKRHFSELIEVAFQRHNGRIIKTTGDGLIAEFPSIVDAVQCSVFVQREMKVREADVAEDRRIRYRIGINLGDVIFDDGDVYGDGVNIAARLEGLADPGGIVVSGTAHDMLKSNVDVDYVSLGEQQVKNISTPVRVYKVITDETATPAAQSGNKQGSWRAALAAVVAVAVAVLAGVGWWVSQPDFEPVDPENLAFALPDQKSIVVTPFRNQTGDEAQDYIPDALTESIIDALATEPELTVISRAQSLKLKDAALPAGKVAEKLGVQFVLEGSVSGSPGKLKIRARLSDALSGQIVWRESWEDRASADVFEILDQISDHVLVEMQVRHTLGDIARAWRRTVNTPEQHQMLVRGRVGFQQFTPEGHAKAREEWNALMEASPERALPYYLAAWLDWQSVMLGLSKDAVTDLAKAREKAQRAISMEANGEFYNIVATLDLIEGKHDDAILAAQKALELAPGSSDVAQVTGYVLGSSGRLHEGIEQLERGMRLEPDYPTYVVKELAFFKLQIGDLDGAREIARGMAHADTKDPRGRLHGLAYLAAIAVWKGDPEAARRHIEEIMKLRPDITRQYFTGDLSEVRDQDFVAKYVDALVAAGLSG